VVPDIEQVAPFPEWVKEKVFVATSDVPSECGNIFNSLSDENKDFFLQCLDLSAEKAFQLCNMTVKQSQSSMWRDERKSRLTASRAHRIFRARSDVKRVEYFLDMKSLEGIAGVQYGLEMESTAREKFIELTGFSVVETGLVVKKNLCWLAASPDGLFLDERDRLMVLEIKCPSSCKDLPINVEYIKDDELKKSHPYYTQIQLTMFVCNAEEAAFFVYSSVDQKCLRVPFDQAFV
jgi:hypothetical protein